MKKLIIIETTKYKKGDIVTLSSCYDVKKTKLVEEWERKMVACKKNNTEGMELFAKMGDVLNKGLDLINKKA